MSTKMKINFADLGMPVFTGRTRGEQTRKQLSLGAVRDGDSVEVLIPPEVYAVTSSYFLGLFGPSIRDLGLEAFQRVFRFVAPDYLRAKMDDWTLRAVREKGDLFS